MLRITTLILGILLNTAAFSQLRFTKSEILDDYQYLIRKLEEIHPNVFHSISRETLTRHFSQELSGVNESLTQLEAYRLFQKNLTLLKEGHTSMRYPAEELERIQKGELQVFPLKISIVDNQIFASKPDSASGVSAGDRIMTINGIEATDIIAGLMMYASGETPAFRLKTCELYFAYLLYFEFGFRDSFRITWDHAGQINSFVLQGLDMAARTTRRSDFYSFSILEDYPKIGYLKIRLMFGKSDFRNFLKSAFAEFKANGVDNLIIDIRNNPGGNSQLADVLFDYITDKSYKQADLQRIKVSKASKKENRKRYIKWYVIPLYPLTFLGKVPYAMFNAPSGKIITVESHRLRKPRTPKNKFEGESFLITNSATYSSAFILANSFAQYDMGPLIGEAPGGLIKTYGDVMTFALPHSKLSVGTSYKEFWHPGDKIGDLQLHPDYPLKVEPKDLTNNGDAFLDFTIELINKREKASSGAKGN